MITVQNLTKSYGSHVLLDDISFQIGSKEKIGLVGRNGHGKSTLLRILTGEEHADSGIVAIPREYRVGWLKQNLSFTQANVVLEGATGLPEHEQDAIWKVERILSGLGFSEAMMNREPAKLSGGYQVRLHLAKILLSDADLLLLDEPNNYLDITSIRWLAEFLQNWPGELLLITHDRFFMDRVITHTMAIHRQKIRKIKGDTEKLYTQIAQEEEIFEKTRINDEKKRKEVELFISRFRAKARLAGMVQSRVKSLEKQGRKERLEKIRDLDFRFHEKNFAAKSMLTVEELSFGYDSANLLFQKLSFSVAAGDRIAIIGQNGRGKTTLLKLIAQKLQPLSGKFYFHPETEFGYYEQTNISSLVAERTIAEEINAANRNLDTQSARAIAGAMMFEGDDSLKKIKVLSGGEKCRVMLGKILAAPVNLLLLDEPTNHLDLQSCDALLEAIDSFSGTVILVTHNEMLLHSLAERLVVFQDDKATFFDGTYQEFLERIGWQNEKNLDRTKASSAIVSEGKPVNKKELRRQRTEILNERNRNLKPLEQQISKLEEEISHSELEQKRVEADLVKTTSRQDGKQIQKLARELHQTQMRIEELFSQLEKAQQGYDQQKKGYDERLQSLESQL